MVTEETSYIHIHNTLSYINNENYMYECASVRALLYTSISSNGFQCTTSFCFALY